MSIELLAPGLYTTVQDLGRYGYQRYGVIVGGAMDTLAMRLANLLVGNEPNAAVLELTVKGPVLLVHQDLLLAVCGADMQPTVDGVRIRRNRPVWVKKGSTLTFAHARTGCRAYLAVAGGWDVPLVMDSRSTNVRAGFGGAEGRTLRAKDRLQPGKPSELGLLLGEQLKAKSKARNADCCEMDWFVPFHVFPYPKEAVVRVMRGEEFAYFSEASRRQFFATPYRLAAQSDRMGYRLDGPELALESPLELISAAVSAGTIQVPPNGQPIMLLADRQTVGGYPKIAHVATVDLPIVAQLRPGDRVQFQEVSLREAQQALYKQESELRQIRLGIEINAGRR
ncbi:biotin-dependent carboxyltransferase family protein [Brevibacillus sp. SAFN-007a]|uniref:5-oxoprolinase subunit C family protein n=1 Tax=Brevibacillus sp. SAFN-007a TaxID=3436862 RepID=UPI003F80C8DC